MNFYKNAFVAILILFQTGFYTQIIAQSSTSSPYSHYGIGDLSVISNSRTRAMGSIGFAMRSYYNIFPQNPASYSSFDTLSFVFDGGMQANFSTLQTGLITADASNAGLSYLYFGFPVTPWLRTSFGAMPYSSIGYKVYDEITDPFLGRIRNVYEGDGGVNLFYLGNAFRISKNFSAGFNAYYLSGKLQKSRILSYPDSTYILNTRVKDITYIGDLNFSAGLQYYTNVGKNTQLTLGLVYGHSKSLNAKKETLVETLLGGIGGGYEAYKDTISYETGIKGNVKLPLTLGGGFSIEKADNWLIGADFEYGFWEDFLIFSKADSLKNSYRISAGFEFTPNNTSISKYWQKIKYRGGFKFNKTYLDLKNNQINDFGITFGVGLPLKRLATTINMGAEIGSRGTLENDLIKDSYFRLFLGISITERWFIKRKYD
ncbi:MAG: hypothetical protein Q7J34_13855 [Bacteroidales bacterium]|nr:hypothetical protein [Bacteroidales bacterium]